MCGVLLDQLPWREVDELSRKISLAILPIGATEQYGPHLPLCTDGLVARWLALRVAERHGGLVTPLIPVGNSSLFLDFPCTLSISDAVVYEIVRDVGSGLHSSGFQRLLVINGHAGNSPSISRYLAEEARKLFEAVLQIDVWRLAEAVGQDLFAGISGAFGHAGPCATSVMMAIAPDLVRQNVVEVSEPVALQWPAGVYLPISFRTTYPSGYAGDVRRASPEKGRTLLEKMVDHILAVLQEAGVPNHGDGEESRD